MYKILIALCIIIILSGCSETNRESTVDRVHYGAQEVTILFKDGLVITTSDFDRGIEPGDTVSVIHLSDGEIRVRK